MAIKRLVLGRFPGESIQIDGPCTITLLRVIGDKARIAIDADETI